MDAATATLALLVVLRGPVDARGHGSAAAIVGAPAGTAMAATTVDGCVATARGPSRRANVAWGVALDPRFGDKERFRDARQIALYFVSHVQDGDAMSVVVAGAAGARASGVHGLAELTALRAPLDATLDPEARRDGAGAGPVDVLALARAESERAAATAPTGEVRLHVAVALEETGDGAGTEVRLAGEALDVREAIAEGASQSRGPRLVAEIARRLAATSRVDLDLACATSGDEAARERSAPASSTSPSPTFSARVVAIAAALALVFVAAALVWRHRRGG
jgi:hypothetical protein